MRRAVPPAGTTGGGRGEVVWPKCAACPRPHAEEHRSANGSTDAPTPSERCDASRSMRGCSVAILILRDARMRVRVCGTSSSACALLRMRTSIAYCIAHHLKQPISFPRRISASGVCIVASLTPHRGVGGAPRNVRVQRHPLGVHITRHARRLARRLASHNAGRSPLGAPPWRFLASGPRFRLLRRPPSYNGGHLPSDPCSELLAARS